jgi:Pretoxin HINT domain
MIGLIVCSAVLAANPPADSAPPPATYAQARSQTGRSPDDQVKLALWCEAHGLAAERLHHLTLAVLTDPKHAAARGLMGLVSLEGRWLRPESVADRLKVDPSLIEYETRRKNTPETAAGNWDLGVWADEHGLVEQAKAHFTAVTRLDPSRSDAWKRLGYKKQGGRWVTDEQVAAEKAEGEARIAADRVWKPLLEKYRQMLALPSKRDEAEAALLEVTDPRAVPSIGRVFASTEAQQPRAVRMLGQIDSPQATRALAFLAVYARSDKARRAAAETLRHRDPREFADALIALLSDPIRFEIKHVDGPDSPGELLIEGKKANLRRVYTPPSPLKPGDQLGRDASGRAVVYRGAGFSSGHIELGTKFGGLSQISDAELQQALPIMEESLAFRPLRPTTAFRFYFANQAMISIDQLKVEAEKSAMATEQQLREDARMLEDHNVAVRIGNDRVVGVLNDATGQSLPSDRRTWATWWVDRVGYASSSTEWTSKPSVSEEVDIAYQTPFIPDGAAQNRQVIGYDRRSCFGAGTSVMTSTGPRAIETLRVGDRVLAQNVETGALDYRAILTVHRNPPSPTFRVQLNGEPIVASPFHRFWVAGQGWVMARDLKAGDPIRTLGDVSPVESIKADAMQLVYNLDVADDADFFAGPAAALVHDNTLPDPRIVAFDRAKAR